MASGELKGLENTSEQGNSDDHFWEETDPGVLGGIIYRPQVMFPLPGSGFPLLQHASIIYKVMPENERSSLGNPPGISPG